MYRLKLIPSNRINPRLNPTPTATLRFLFFPTATDTFQLKEETAATIKLKYCKDNTTLILGH
jgi:hypothetical protein